MRSIILVVYLNSCLDGEKKNICVSLFNMFHMVLRVKWLIKKKTSLKYCLLSHQKNVLDLS